MKMYQLYPIWSEKAGTVLPDTATEVPQNWTANLFFRNLDMGTTLWEEHELL